MAQSRSTFREGFQIDDLRSYVVLMKDSKSICRVKCSKPSIAIPENWTISKFVKEDKVPSELHSALIHPASVDDREKSEWPKFLRFLKTNKKVGSVNTEDGDLYIIPPDLNNDFSYAVVKYLMHHQHTVTRTQTRVHTERPADCCSVDNHPITPRVETCTKSVSSKDTCNRSVSLQTRKDEEIGELSKRPSSKDSHMSGFAPKCYTGDNLDPRVEISKIPVSGSKEQISPVKNYVCVNPSYLKTLGQTHSDWIFGAIAELVDNSRDAKATKLDISIDMIHPNISGDEIPMLEVVDDGHGMGHDDILKMLMFGRKQSDTNDPSYIGTYGIGFKTATMRLGKDALVLTQTTHSRSIAFLSQSLNEGQFMELDTKIQSEASAKNNLESIMEYSPFNEYFIGEKAGLFERKGTGTHIYIWNLDKWGSEYSLEWDTGLMKGGSSFHNGDILIRSHRARSRLGQMTLQVKLDFSLRSYLEVIFLDPRIKIAVQGSTVKSRPLAKFLHKTSIKTGNVSGKPVTLVLGRSQVDLENGNCGIFLYWRGRLIEAYKRVGSMIHNGEKSHGIVGVIDVTDVMDNGSGTGLVHNNKQGFVECETYALLKDWLSEKADEYLDETIDKVYVKRGGARHKPDREWVQCDKCRKWRKLPQDFNSQTLPQEWFCYLKPFQGKCEMPEEKQQHEIITIASGRKGYKRKNTPEEQLNKELDESIHDHDTMQVVRRALKRKCKRKQYFT